jgi:hypothetical protein
MEQSGLLEWGTVQLQLSLICIVHQLVARDLEA